jgi:hypothetical protein
LPELDHYFGAVRKSLQFGQFQLDILERNESVLEFRSPEEALDYLKRFKGEKSAIRFFQKLLSESPETPDGSAEKVLSQMAEHLASGKFRLLRTVLPLNSSQTAEVEEAPPEGKSAAPRKSSWIEINLRDPDGKPVPRERYRIKLPDGSIQEGSLDAYGHAEYYGINPGLCEVSFLDREDGAWEKI